MPIPLRLLCGVAAALLALPAVAPALAAPGTNVPVSMPPTGAEGERITLSMLLMGEALPESGPNAAFIVRVPQSATSSPFGDGIRASAASCSSISVGQGSCGTAFANAPGTVRTIFIYPTGFVGTVSVTILEEPSQRATAAYACRSPAASTGPVGFSCTGSNTFSSDADTLRLDVGASGVGIVMVEVR